MDINDQTTCLVSYPKSGSTWLRFLVANCLSEVSCDFTNLHELIPDTHLVKKGPASVDRPVLCKAHDRYRPDFRRVIYLVRDGRDVAVSYYFHWKKHHPEDRNISFGEFLGRFNTGSLDPFGTWHEHVLSWLDSECHDLMTVRYEDLRDQTHAQLHKVMEFLGAQVSDTVVCEAIKRSSFRRMQQLEREQHHACPTLEGSDPSIPFVRSGKVGEYRTLFTPRLLADFEKCHRTALERLGYLQRDEDTRNRPGAPASALAEVTSPVTGTANVEKEQVIDVRFVCRLYRQNFEIDVEAYFKGQSELEIYRCLDTGYRFYSPLGFEGDSRFYQALETFPWYYMNWKPEHDIALPHVNSTDKVLEVGCARGAFLGRLRQAGVDVVGLELNRHAAAQARQKGIVVLEESIQLHAQRSPGQYDFVCFFQVLEHISDVRNFVQAAVDLLKPDGTLCIGVPNYDSFVGLDNANPLEMPPHHVGMWTERALCNLAKVFDLEVMHVECESLQSAHVEYFSNVARARVANMAGLHDALHRVARDNRSQLKGHTVVAIYRKRKTWK